MTILFTTIQLLNFYLIFHNKVLIDKKLPGTRWKKKIKGSMFLWKIKKSVVEGKETKAERNDEKILR